MNEKGMTLMELLIAGIIFMAFLTSFTCISITHDRHLMYLMNRLTVSRAARTARAVLLSDLAAASTVALSGPGTLQINFAGSPSRWTSYVNNAGSLVRQDSATNSTTVVAHYVDSANFAIDTNQNATIAFSFTKGSASVQLSMVFNTPAAGA
jgi:hypothetical protein